MNIRMPLISIIIGLLLILQGLGFWLASSTGAVTSLIPAFLGIVIALLGILSGVAPPARKHAMHLAMLVAVIGVLGGGVMSIRGLAGGGPTTEAIAKAASTNEISTAAAEIQLDTQRWTKIWAQGLLGGICAVYLGMGVATFISARKGGNSPAVNLKGD